jgi:hypothetical protein
MMGDDVAAHLVDDAAIAHHRMATAADAYTRETGCRLRPDVFVLLVFRLHAKLAVSAQMQPAELAAHSSSTQQHPPEGRAATVRVTTRQRVQT